MTGDGRWVRRTHPTPGTTGRADGEGEWVWERGVHKLCREVKLLIANDFKNILTNK